MALSLSLSQLRIWKMRWWYSIGLSVLADLSGLKVVGDLL